MNDADKTGEYVVVARRYRPSNFTDLVGQDQAATALKNAITSNRVGHAYLFTGARGVGKTSTARIFAKALNCIDGPTATPCGQCDVCTSISRGEDVDVLEIDGASNRGIDEIRQLRSNVNVRPSRGRFKVYIIDEVHMLTTPAFNALLKTLEEPPEHVKFIFCTTDPDKIPITVLSRCQRFDFAPVKIEAITERLKLIVDNEGVAADDEALRLLARRAAGSMRDSQSLLEQLLSFAPSHISADDVHRMLGTAQSGRLLDLTQRILARDTAGALNQLDAAVQEGVEAGQLLEQMLGNFRDVMVAAVGGPAELLLYHAPQDYDALVELGRQFGLQTLLAIAGIFEEALVRLRQSPQTRTVMEIALARSCALQDLDALSDLVAQVKSGEFQPSPRTAASPNPPSAASPTPPASSTRPLPQAVQKKSDLTPQNQPPASTGTSSNRWEEPAAAEQIWAQALADLEDMTADYARQCDRVAISAPNRLVVSFKAGYSFNKEHCERSDRKARIEAALSRVTGRPMRLDLELLPDSTATESPKQPQKTRLQLMRETEKHPLVSQAIRLFDAELVRVDRPGK